MPAMPAISVVVPCFNEELVIPECHARLTRALTGLNASYEIIYVDDGSKDGTLTELRALRDADANVAIIELSRNFGHQTAVTAGLDIARGDVVVLIDADLQDPPEVIPQMLEIWWQGYEVVYGVRASRAGESGFKLWSASTFYYLINKMSDIEIPLHAGDFRLLDRRAVEALKRLPERQRLLRGMCSWIGFRQYGLVYLREPRFAGETKYPLGKMLRLALDGITSFSTVPLRLVSLLGIFSALLATFGILYTLIVRLFTHDWVQGWALTFIGILFIGGVQLISLGILGEYVGRIYNEAKQRPLYFARNVYHRRGEEDLALAGLQHPAATPAPRLETLSSAE